MEKIIKKPITRRKKKQPKVNLPDGPFFQCGHFFSVDMFSSEEKEMLTLVTHFYTSDIIEKSLVPLIRQRHIVSLRSLDWLATNYAKKTSITYFTDPSQTKKEEQIIMIYKDYNDWLRRYHRNYFDPFCRKIKKMCYRTGRFHKGGLVYFFHCNEPYITTVAQLMFVYWAIYRGVLDYAQTHIDEINIDMKQCMEDAKAQKKLDKITGTKRKRQELNKAPRAKCVIISRSMKTVFSDDDDARIPIFFDNNSNIVKL